MRPAARRTAMPARARMPPRARPLRPCASARPGVHAGSHRQVRRLIGSRREEIPDRRPAGLVAARRHHLGRAGSARLARRRLRLVPQRLAGRCCPRAATRSSSCELPALEVGGEHPYLLAYTSGTTGRPKGALHVHGGFLLSIAREAAYQADLKAGDRVLFATDMGWIMGPWTVVGAGAVGATVVFMEGAPDWPEDRLWRLVESERMTMLGVSPTLVRALIPKGEPTADLSSLRAVTTTGRAVEPRPVRLAERARLRRRADPDREHLGRDRGRGMLPGGEHAGADEALLAGISGTRPGHGRLRRRGPTAPRRGRRARLQAPLAGHDARHLAAIPSATWRPTGGGSRASGLTATGPRSTRTATGSCTAAPTTR